MATTSLVPGVLYKSTGLNQNHTPTEVLAEPETVKNKYRRSSIPAKQWPPDSPVARIYDVRNSSSRLILLNNRLNKKSHLRVQSGRYDKAQKQESSTENDSTDADIKQQPGSGIDPERHFRSSSPPNPDRHHKCSDSSSPKFVANTQHPAAARYNLTLSREQGNKTPRAPVAKEWHHYSSYPEHRAYRASTTVRKSKPSRDDYLIPPPSFSANTGWLHNSEMTRGQKRYINSIAMVYDMTNMKQLTQAQYIQLIHRETVRGFFTKEEFDKYLKYLNGERMRPFLVRAAPSVLQKQDKKRRVQSAPRPARARQEDDDSTQTTESPKEQSNNTTPKEQTKDGREIRDSKKKPKSPTPPPAENRRVNKSKKSAASTTTNTSTTSPREGTTSPYDEVLSVSSQDGPKSAQNKQKKKKSKYWEQPSKPVKEKEPDGKGLEMTRDKNLNLKGENIQDTTTSNEK